VGRWYDYLVDMRAGGRLAFYWDGARIFDAMDRARTSTSGPMGMRLDYFDIRLDDTHVYRP